ncbi:MAG: excalibur calcium-binding domain-containing protein [Mesorhizobium sp.]|nr:MAG: excalibur calcium-binding domain-containing protein [Mesorhizobium sp.]
MWAGSFQAPWDWRAEHDDQGPSKSNLLGLVPPRALVQSWTCQPRRTCSQINSCDEAQWYLNSCSWGRKLDRDGDGIACETLC